MSNIRESIHVLKSIGVLHTPYIDNAPYQPVKDDENTFYITLKEEYEGGLKFLETFKYIYVIYYLDKAIRTNKKTVTPPWAEGMEVGLFASRSPNRPNPIGISVVELKSISKNVIYINGIDAFDNTPVLDIKPYIDELDAKKDANLGWVEKFDDNEHLLLHIKGIPHDH